VRSVIVRSYTSIWRWVQRLGPVLGSISADPRFKNNVDRVKNRDKLYEIIENITLPTIYLQRL
jgi:crotonobetainyl-CoA:carnitine CoA-transferase CaiB-like acyl-CoA transferase